MRVGLLATLGAVGALGTPSWMNPRLTPRERAEQLLKNMTHDQKISMTHGVVGAYVGNTAAISSLKIPALRLNDGPQGFRAANHDGTSTQWPSGLTVAASWDVDLMHQWGVALGQEFKGKGANVLLGPGLNVARVPVCGRNFEYLSGEDPWLGAAMVKPYVVGVQSQNIIANAKHYVHNNQETHRTTIDAHVGEQVAWQIYYPPFTAAVEAGVYSFMCSYNLVNGSHACENSQTLNVDLKQRMGFEGWVMSDWTATHSGKKAADAGLDQEMPTGIYFSTSSVSDARLNDMVLRILTPMFAVGLFDSPPSGNITSNVTSAAHNALARKLAAESTILLQNNGILPVGSGVKKIAVIGSAAQDSPVTGGGGSGRVVPHYIVTPLAGIRAAAQSSGIEVVYDNGADATKAATVAAGADLAILVAATSSSEGSDRSTLGLGSKIDDLFNAVAAKQPKSVAVVYSPGAVLLPWASKMGAVLLGLLPGQEEGNALADVLFGHVNPAARLPVTIPNKDNEVGFTADQYPGVNNVEHYTEGLFIGYRWYEAKQVTPHFAFGHGLSYTTFEYSGLYIDAQRNVHFNVTNTGAVSGREVAQLYVSYPSSYKEPVKELRQFAKTPLLAPKQSTAIQLPLTDRALSVWDVNTHKWALVRGEVGVLVGSASNDIKLKGSILL